MPTSLPLKEVTVRVQVNGTTIMAVYEVQDGQILLTSADFGEGAAPLSDATPDETAATLLRGMAEAGMAKDGPYMRDDELPPGRRGKG